MAAYKQSEFKQTECISRMTDVWSRDILILELLTEKFLANYLCHGKGFVSADLAAWVKSVVKEEWTVEVFDAGMIKTMKNEDGKIVKLLKIRMLCCEEDVEKRFELKETVEKIEELFFPMFSVTHHGSGFKPKGIVQR